MQKRNDFYKDPYTKLEEYVHFVYRINKKFPKEEMFGFSSQLRRAFLSVMLNYVEGFAGVGNASYKNFLTIVYGSLKETRYFIQFAFDER